MLPLLLYGDLPPEEIASVERHLADCAACREERAGLQRVQKQLDAAPAPPIHVDLPQLYRLAAERHSSRVRRWRRFAMAVGSVAAALLVVTFLRLEIRVQARQLVLTWGASVDASPTPAPLPPPPATAAPATQSLASVKQQLQLLDELVHALAEDIGTRDRQRKQEILRLSARVRELQHDLAQQRQVTDHDVAALYAAFFGPKEKGTRQ
jgi:anti-sigma factor RsiW